MGSKRKQNQEPDDAPTAAPQSDSPSDATSDVHVELRGDAPAPSPRDAGSIDLAGVPERPFPVVDGPRHTRFQAVIKRSVLKAIARHGATKPDVEVCGVIVGNLFRDKAGPYLYVESIVRGDFASNRTANVTFTAQTWQHIQERMDAKHPNQKILGWYHTHPGFGIFLSKMDLFIHENFFNLPWQTAFVFDPRSGEDGLFVWRNGQAEREPFLVEEDGEGVIDEEEAPPAAASAEAHAATLKAVSEIASRIRKIERRNRSLMMANALIVLLAIAWPFVLFTWLNAREQETSHRLPPKSSTASVDNAGNESPAMHPVLASYAVQPLDRPGNAEATGHEKATGFASAVQAFTLQPSTMPSPVATPPVPATFVLPAPVPSPATVAAPPQAILVTPQAPTVLAHAAPVNSDQGAVVQMPINSAGAPRPQADSDWATTPKPEVIRPTAGPSQGAKVLDTPAAN